MAEWTGRWIIEKMKKQDTVKAVKMLTDSLVEIELESSVGKVFCLSLNRVNLDDVSEPIDTVHPDYIVNIKSGFVIDGSALSYCETRSVGIGGVGCLYRAAESGDFTSNHEPESEFIVRGLSQHSKVTKIERKTDRLYRVSRVALRSLDVLAINDYDLTAESVRSHIHKHGSCDLILSSNPNARPTTESHSAARGAQTSIVKWAELLSQLNHV